jgi:hypothetical protein
MSDFVDFAQVNDRCSIVNSRAPGIEATGECQQLQAPCPGCETPPHTGSRLGARHGFRTAASL